MSRLIDADALRKRMYRDAFETDTDMQMWDSGCWIRYKMFENAVNDAPTIDAVEVVRCGECGWHGNADSKTYCPNVGCQTQDDWFCADGIRKVQE